MRRKAQDPHPKEAYHEGKVRSSLHPRAGQGSNIKFYQEALGMKMVREMAPRTAPGPTPSWRTRGALRNRVTWNRGQVEPYDNGGKDTHIAFAVDDLTLP